MKLAKTGQKIMPIWEKTTFLLYKNKVCEALKYIDDTCKKNNIWDKKYKVKASNFIFRRDIIEMTYSNTLKILKESILKDDFESAYIAFEIISSKLRGYQRYTYFDRDEMLQLLDTDDEYNTEKIEYIKYNPPGLSSLSAKDNMYKNLRSIYMDSEKKDIKYFNNELKRAIKENNVFHHIVDMDRYLRIKNFSKFHILHLCNLLNAYYSSEKYKWTEDLTEDYLNLYNLLKDKTNNKEFKDFTFQLVSTSIKTSINKSKINKQTIDESEIFEIIHYLEKTNELSSNNRYLDYINMFEKII